MRFFEWVTLWGKQWGALWGQYGWCDQVQSLP